MIISQLVVKTNLSTDALDMVIRSTAKHCQPQLRKEAIYMIALLLKMQVHYGKMQKR